MNRLVSSVSVLSASRRIEAYSDHGHARVIVGRRESSSWPGRRDAILRGSVLDGEELRKVLCHRSIPAIGLHAVPNLVQKS
jgi:hypothetical protein